MSIAYHALEQINRARDPVYAAEKRSRALESTIEYLLFLHGAITRGRDAIGRSPSEIMRGVDASLFRQAIDDLLKLGNSHPLRKKYNRSDLSNSYFIVASYINQV